MTYQLKNRHAVITGASSGIGAALAVQMAKQGCHLHLVARREEKLRQLAKQLETDHGIQTHVYTMDLSEDGAADALVSALDAHPISVVVNNAGIGMTGIFEKQDRGVIRTMINLNVRFTTEFTYLMVGKLKGNGEDVRILNVGSVAGFQGVHHFMPYASTKAYVNHFSEGLNWELRGTNITVTCLAPGATRSEFIERAKMTGSFMGTYDVMTTEAVAAAGIKALKAGKACVIPGLTNKIKIFSLRITPRWMVRLTIKWMFRDLAH